MDTYNVRVTLTAGRSSGSVAYSGVGFSCSGVLDLVNVAATQLTMNQGITHGNQCENGQVTITRAGTDAIGFRFTSSGPVAAGTLHRR